MDTIQVDLELCFGCGDYNKTFRSGPRAFCSNCGAKLSHSVMDYEAPKLPAKANPQK